ncbi:MAG: amino acid permease [Pirellulaceae bacterium]|jgi:amino acid transporter|nr:amino acid permease [Pirellulaceae bacterium]MCU0978673.1 amino acid permease [Pirellulaceae bacterium]
MTDPHAREPDDDSPYAHLGLWDAVSIILGIVVGTAIFKTPQYVFANVHGPWLGMGCWLLGGVLALLGSLCYAELATTYPRMGGDYVYLTRAFGRGAGFLFGWAQLTVILTGSIGAMAYAFGDYAVEFFGWDPKHSVWLAVASVAVLTILNMIGVVFGKSVQNLLTAIKVVGLGAIVVAGFAWGGDPSWASQQPMAGPGFGLAMVFVLYAYGGWNDAAFVAAEVRHRHRNMPLALILGTAGITVIYLLVNAALLWGLGFEGIKASSAPAADVAKLAFGTWGSKGISLLVMASALGAINGLIFTGSRIYVSLGADHRIFAWLGRWNAQRGAPLRSLVTQSAIALLLILIVGTQVGRDSVDTVMTTLQLNPLPWDKYFGGFDTLVAATAPVFWAFFLLTGYSLFLLRAIDRDIHRPFSAPFYPLEPILFCGMCHFMLFSAIDYAKGLSLLGLVPLAVGLPLYALSQWSSRPKAGQSPKSP